jgi:hypothetical protein
MQDPLAGLSLLVQKSQQGQWSSEVSISTAEYGALNNTASSTQAPNFLLPPLN